MNNLYIVDRDSNDWDQLSIAPLELQKAVVLKRCEHFHQDRIFYLFEQWDKIYSKKYFETRAAIKRIALANWKKLQPTAIINREEVLDLAKSPSWFLFSDDDDFYHPKLGDILRTLPLTPPLVSWRHIAGGDYNFPTKIGQWFKSSYVDTNCYGVSSELLSTLTKETLQTVYKHGFIHKNYERESHSSLWAKKQKEHLSFVNRSPVSISLYKRHYMHTPEMLINCVELFCKNTEQSIVANSASPFIEELKQVYSVFHSCLQS